jgi:3-oxo-5alpha-steroid 4-dehydrogenase
MPTSQISSDLSATNTSGVNSPALSDDIHSTLKRAPLVAENPETLSWNDSADIVVVGFGSAGAVTALQAQEAGASVIIVDRFDGGGATAFSGGVIYAGNTKHQRAIGVQDSSEEMYKYLLAEGTPVSSNTLRRFCEQSHDDVDWLESYGVEYGSTLYKEKTNYPPDGYWLYFSGNERSPGFVNKAVPAPRGHRAISRGFSGKAYFAKLRAAVTRLGMKVYEHSPVTRVVTDARGNVLGVEINSLPAAAIEKHRLLYKRVTPWRLFNNRRAEKAIVDCRVLEEGSRTRMLLRARRGVVLCAGGFIYNLGLLGIHQPLLGRNYETLLRLGSMGDDGSGIALGESVGGATALMDSVFTARTITPPIVFPRGVLVNQRGERFVDEAAYNGIVGRAISQQPENGTAWLVLGARDFWTAIRQSLFPGKGLFINWGLPTLLNVIMGGTRRSKTLRGLAKVCGIDESGFERSIEAFNQMINQNAPDPRGKVRELLQPIADRAYYAINVSLSNKYAPMIAVTMGGLQVDEDTGAVKRDNGSIIAGLYAAGRVAIGLCSKGYISGMSIADTVFSGRRAGRSAAKSQ